MRCIGIRITGEVQGVSFREVAKQCAFELGLSGFARNESDGSVYMEVEGEEVQIQKFTEWCHSGPPEAKVAEVTVTRLPLHDFDGFRVERER